MAEYQFKALGKATRAPSRELETFPAPAAVTKVILESDEVTSLCPVTGQPDWRRYTSNMYQSIAVSNRKALSFTSGPSEKKGFFVKLLQRALRKMCSKQLHQHR